jgi:hypothetical protein
MRQDSSVQRASLASEMWSRVYDMHAQQQRDRRLRSRFLVLELLLLAVTLFSLVRVGMPELLCPERFEDGEEAGTDTGRVANAWFQTVCGSWGGLLAPAGLGLSEVDELQRQRTRSLNLALDKLVSTAK